MQAIERTALPVQIEGNGVDFRAARFGDMSVGWIRLPAGTDLRPALAGLPGDLCPCPHWGYMISGSLVMHGSEGDTRYDAVPFHGQEVWVSDGRRTSSRTASRGK